MSFQDWEPCCEKCLFYQRIDMFSGRCRRFPPVYHDRLWQHPITYRDYWCGEWRNRYE